MSDLAYTPTRQTAQAAMMKAQDAYAVASQAREAAAGVAADIADLRSEIAMLKARLVAVDNGRATPTRRKAA